LGQGELTMIITQPVMSSANEQIVGVLAGRLSLNALGEIMTDHTGLQESGETYLVSPENNYLVTPIRHTSEAYTLRRAYRSIGINEALTGTSGAGTYLNYQEPPVPVIGVYRWLPNLQVALLAEISEAEALSLFARVRRFSTLMATGAAFIAIVAGFYLATRISKPINTLIQATIQFAQGDLNKRVKIDQHNEISLLAVGFNQMAADIKELIDSLEQRVADRTQRLKTVVELGEKLSAVLDLEQLLAEVVNQVEEKFDYYHAHIYLIDERRENLVVAEGTGAAGREMKANRHSIPLNAETSLVARAARSGAPVWVANVREAADWLPNPLLPDTYSEIAVPIILEGEVVGILDVQEDEIGGFDEGDESLLRSLANQVAVAIRNARLFEQIETALAEAKAVQKRYLEQAWAKTKIVPASRQYLYVRPDTSAADRAGKQQMLSKIQQQAHTQNQPAIINVNSDDINEGISMVAPVALRDKVIGALQLHRSSTDRSWTDEDLDMIEVIAEQFAQTAENLRLFDETRRHARREQTIRQVAEKIRSAENLSQLVQITAEELGQRFSMEYALVDLGIERKEAVLNQPQIGRNHSQKKVE
ncbi:MAG: GAF domain-containing protein, partial [Anaerolineae bacterium]|nr:GAF domain-containing protein [Anaerolineae bacterium]